MNNQNQTEQPSTARSLLVPGAIAAAFLVWALLIFFTVGVKWPPAWYYGSVADVPGQSALSSFEAEKISGVGPAEIGKRMPQRQHVMGRFVKEGEVQQPPAP